MAIEGAQILSTAYRLQNPDTDLQLYKKTHENHPCVKWVMEKESHFNWLYYHVQAALALFDVYSNRTVGTHKTWRVMNILKSHVGRNSYAGAFPEEFVVVGDNNVRRLPPYEAVDAYRKIYRNKKMEMTWKNGAPDWFYEWRF